MLRLKHFALAVVACAAIAGGFTVQAENQHATEALKHSYTSVQDNAERAKGLDVAYFAGGCFWGTQSEFKSIPGVLSTAVGYTGGKTENPTYQAICRHDTGHAEAVRVVFDPKKVTFDKLVNEFLELHDPTTLNRQGPDIGDQYRSAIFFEDDKQKSQAQSIIAAENKKMTGGKHIVTSLEPLTTFYTAEEYHQNYFEKTGQASCHVRPKK